MDDGLVAAELQDDRYEHYVLILVLVDDGLVGFAMSDSYTDFGQVLILVLVDDGLVEELGK